MNVTKITIGRLFNLGSYEHVRYEIAVEIADGESPATALIGLEKILEALNPRCPCQSKDEIKRSRFRLSTMEQLDDEQFERQHGGYTGTRSEYTERIRQGIVDEEAKLKVWQDRHSKARKLLEDLGGAANWKDAKLDWEDDF